MQNSLHETRGDSATASYTRSFQDGPLKTLGLTTVFIPTAADFNSDFGIPRHNDVAVKLYGLIGHTDVDMMVLSGGAKSLRYGLDFSSALSPALELHGELARIADSTRTTVINMTGQLASISGPATSYLLGFNFLTQADTTIIVEYYHNGEGFQEQEGDAFYTFTHNAFAQYTATGNPALLQRVQMLSPMYMRPNPMRNYVNLKISQKEPFNIVYFTPSISVQANLTDHSFLVLPEFLYTGVKNVELRLRLQANIGRRLTEFGEKQAATRVEFRLRYFF